MSKKQIKSSRPGMIFITADVKVIPIQIVNEAYERLIGGRAVKMAISTPPSSPFDGGKLDSNFQLIVFSKVFRESIRGRSNLEMQTADFTMEIGRFSYGSPPWMQLELISSSPPHPAYKCEVQNKTGRFRCQKRPSFF